MSIERTIEALVATKPYGWERTVAHLRREELPSHDSLIPKCIHRGEEIRREKCETCKGNWHAKIEACAIHGECTKFAKPIEGVKFCGGCKDAVVADESNHDFTTNALTPLSVRRYDATNLAPELPGERFNASVIRWKGRELLAWRHNRKGSSIKITDLGTGQTWPIDLQHTFAAYGREDGRIAIVADKLFIVFTGVGHGGSVCVLYAEIVEDNGGFKAGKVWYPDYAGRAQREKNWSLFDYDGRMMAVYSIAPHRVLAINGSNAELAFETPWEPPWVAGELRGGASPVLVGDEYWCWFHGMDARDRQYTCGVYTFDAKPPFRPRRCTKWPVIVATNEGRPASERNLAWYCCGSYLDGGEWVVSGGVHNSFIEVRRYRVGDVEAVLATI